MSKLKLGVEAKDKISGFTGVIIGHADYLTGCDQFLLSPKCEEDKNHTKPESLWFDDGRIEYVGDGIHAKEVESDTGNGADISAPTK